MKLKDYREEVEKVQSYGLRSMAWIPKNSFYRVWISRMNEGNLEVQKYVRLKNKLQGFWKEEWS